MHMACARDVDFTSSPPPRPGAQHSLSALGCVGVAAPLSSSSMFFVSNSSHHHHNRCRHDRMYQLHYPPSPPSPPCRQAVSGTTALSHTIAVAATKLRVVKPSQPPSYHVATELSSWAFDHRRYRRRGALTAAPSFRVVAVPSPSHCRHRRAFVPSQSSCIAELCPL